MRGRGLWVVLAALLWGFATLLVTSDCEAGMPMVCVVRVGRPADEKLLERVRGQTSDLPVSLVRVSGPVEAELDAARARADELAQSFGARGIVWFVDDAPGDVTIFVVDAEERRIFVQRVDHRSGTRSAVLESASLVVRDVLQAMTEGRPIGLRMEMPAHDATDVLAPPLRFSAEPARAPVFVLERAPGPRWAPFAAIGFRAVLADDTPSYALHQRLGASLGDFELGAALTLGEQDVRTDAFASLLLRRHTIGAFAGWRLKLAERLTAVTDLHAGVALFFRSTRPVSSRAVPLASRTIANAFVGPELRMAWAPGPSWLRLSLGIGADVVFAPPATSYENLRGEKVGTLALWPVQPYVTASLEMWASP